MGGRGTTLEGILGNCAGARLMAVRGALYTDWLLRTGDAALDGGARLVVGSGVGGVADSASGVILRGLGLRGSDALCS